nr:DUF1194 domain-containing protein [Pelagovum pacificum]
MLPLFGALAASGAPALAQDCRLALALALDVSSSVDAEEDRQQRLGLAGALLAPEVRAAMFSSPLPVALAAFEWSGRQNQTLILDWTLIDSPAALERAAQRIASSDRSEEEFPTSLGYALGYGSLLLADGPSCLFTTIDVSGDGVNNDGFPPSSAYKAYPFADVTVNGLVVHTGGPPGDEVVAFYRDEVIRGPGAFLEIAQGFDDYERAMRRKLERELTSLPTGKRDLP